MIEALAANIRDMKDFPRKGIVFKDITPLLGDPQAFNMAINLLADRYIGRHIDRVVGVEARGFEQNATRRHDGVDIVAPRGTSIQAAADGEVLFSGWGPGGYGRLVILQHQAEVVTIYAHNNDNLVRLGQRVRQGEPIATVGQSGRATGNHLHFEVRYKAIPISPHKFLPPRPSNVAALERR